MQRAGWIVAIVAAATALYFWTQTRDLKDRIQGLAETTASRNLDLARLAEIDAALDGLDRGFSRGLNGQDALARDFAKLESAPAQRDLRAAIERRIAALKADMDGPAAAVKRFLSVIDPPDFSLDPSLVDDEANAAFLAKIDADPAFERRPSGLRFKRIKTVESGGQPTPESVVTVHYRGSFVDGTEFDSSYKRNKPATFELAGLISGWVEGIPLMKAGETFELVLPYDLAYGAAGRRSIPPRQTLVFRVELLEFGAPSNPQ